MTVFINRCRKTVRRLCILMRGGAVAKSLSVMVDKLIAALKKRGIVAMLLDHVAQFAEVMNQQTLAALVLVVLLQRPQEVTNHVFQFGLLYFERDRQCALQHERMVGLAEAAVEHGTQTFNVFGPHRDRAWLVQHTFNFENGRNQAERADVTSFIACHIEPEFVQCRIIRKNFCEPRVQRHALFFQSDRSFEQFACSWHGGIVPRGLAAGKVAQRIRVINIGNVRGINI
jgi:hypothetical protein